MHHGGSWGHFVDDRLLAANTVDGLRSYLAHLSTRRVTGRDGPESRTGFAGCSAQCSLLEFPLHSAAVYAAHRRVGRRVDLRDLLHHRTHGRKLDCAVEGT